MPFMTCLSEQLRSHWPYSTRTSIDGGGKTYPSHTRFLPAYLRCASPFNHRPDLVDSPRELSLRPSIQGCTSMKIESRAVRVVVHGVGVGPDHLRLDGTRRRRVTIQPR